MSSLFFPIAAVEGLFKWLEFVGTSAQQAIIEFLQTQKHWEPLGEKRRLSFGWFYDVHTRRVERPAPPIPLLFSTHAVRLVEAGLMSRVADQITVQEYQPSQGIGPHIDLEPYFSKTGEQVRGFGPEIVTLSLLSPCVMRFTRDGHPRRDEVLEPRSALAMTSEARTKWRHEIVNGSVRDLRISATFRTVVLPAPGK